MMDYNLYDSFSMCLFDDGGVLGLGTDWSKDSRFKWTTVQDDKWFIGMLIMRCILDVILLNLISVAWRH